LRYDSTSWHTATTSKVLETMQNIDAGNLAKITQVAHSLCGSSAQVGACKIMELWRQVKHETDMNAMRNKVQEVSRLLAPTTAAMEKALSTTIT